MSELKTSQTRPRWVADLHNPAPHKPKNAGFPDPPGYPSSAAPSKARSAVPETPAE